MVLVIFHSCVQNALKLKPYFCKYCETNNTNHTYVKHSATVKVILHLCGWFGERERMREGKERERETSTQTGKTDSFVPWVYGTIK